MTTSVPLGEVIGFLLDTPLFEHLDETELSEIVHILEIQHVGAGEPVFKSGDPADAWFVVFRGIVEVIHDGKAGEHLLSRLGQRACFGEMATLDGAHRSATVRCARDTMLLRIPRAEFNKLLREGHLAAYKLVHRMALILVARLRALNAEVAAGDLPLRTLEVLEPTDQ